MWEFRLIELLKCYSWSSVDIYFYCLGDPRFLEVWGSSVGCIMLIKMVIQESVSVLLRYVFLYS
jgi:hypothetical protein